MKKNNLLSKILCGSLALVGCVVPLNLTSCSKNKNPHEGLKSTDVIQTVESVRRLDKDGHLYFMENTEDYRGNQEILKTIKEWETNENFKINFGCSAFMAHSAYDTTCFTGRVYDYTHLYYKKDENIGLGCTNFMIHTPKNESKKVYHESIGTCDALMFNPDELTFEEVDVGLLDNGKTDVSYLALSPYYTVDGINDAGLTASILLLLHEDEVEQKFRLDSQPGAIDVTTTGKEQMSAVRAVRYILDNCSTVEEAEKAMKENVYVKRIWGANFHIFVTDSKFNSRLFEWFDTDFTDNKQQFISIDTNAVTNFYQAFTKPCDNAPVIQNWRRNPAYHYGYWNEIEAYNRFNTIASMLEFYTPKWRDVPVINEQQADSILRAVDVTDTLFSNLFNSTELTQSLYVNQDFSTKYVYSLKQHKFIS